MFEKYSIKKRGAIQYIYENDKKITGGHHHFILEEDGSISGITGGSKETVMTSDGEFIKNTGFDKEMQDREDRDHDVLNFLNKKNRLDKVILNIVFARGD